MKIFVIAALALSMFYTNARQIFPYPEKIGGRGSEFGVRFLSSDPRSTIHDPFAFPPPGFNYKLSSVVFPSDELDRKVALSNNYTTNFSFPAINRQFSLNPFLTGFLKSEFSQLDNANISFRETMMQRTQRFLKKLDMRNQDLSKQLEYLKEQKEQAEKHAE